jgi:hypothetical protein
MQNIAKNKMQRRNFAAAPQAPRSLHGHRPRRLWVPRAAGALLLGMLFFAAAPVTATAAEHASRPWWKDAFLYGIYPLGQ